MGIVASYGRLPIARQIALATLAVLVLVFGVMITLVVRVSESAADEQAKQGLLSDVGIVRDVLEADFRNLAERAEAQSEQLKHFLGDVRPTGNEVQTGATMLPELVAGGVVLNANRTPLERFKSLSGNEAALLVIKGGRVYRAATLLEKDGQPMQGTAIAAGDPVETAMLAGQAYTGLVVRNGQYYFSVVKPLVGADGKVYGGLSLRVSLARDLERIREDFGKQVSGKTGYTFIIRPTGDPNTVGDFVMHPSFQGKNVQEAGMDAESARSIAHIVAQREGFIQYPLAYQGKPREKSVALAYAPSWGWIIGAGSWHDEYLSDARHLRDVIVGLSAGAGLILCLLLFLLTRGLLAPLDEFAASLARLGTGDLRVRVANTDGSSHNEVHRLGQALNTTAEAVGELVSGASRGAARIGDAASGMGEHSHRVLESSERQSQAATSMAASVEELSVSISQVADSARDAARLSGEAESATADGLAVVQKTISEMERVASEIERSADLVLNLGERSRQISGIVDVIREIAEQTNLLALNAAIEAARAGEQGRGFAVVADEVRKLAERTAQSTREVSGTIEAIVNETQGAAEHMKSVREDVGKGVAQARAAGEALHTIDDRTGRAVGVARVIADSTGEQSSASQEIAVAVERVAQMSEENAQAARENQDAAAQLAAVSEELRNALARFQT